MVNVEERMVRTAYNTTVVQNLQVKGMNPKIPRQNEMRYFEIYTHNTVRACVIVSEMCTTQSCEIFHPVPEL